MNTIENIEKSELLNEECKKEKELFFSILPSIIFTTICILIMLVLVKNIRSNEQDVITAFKNKKELICKSSVVSVQAGYKFEKNNEFFISNGTNIFNIKQCKLR